LRQSHEHIISMP